MADYELCPYCGTEPGLWDCLTCEGTGKISPYVETHLRVRTADEMEAEPEPARDVAARLGASEHDAELPEPRFDPIAPDDGEMGDMHYCGKCGDYRPDCEVLRNQYVCLACCHDGWGQVVEERDRALARVTELEAERDRLRAALKHIANGRGNTGRSGSLGRRVWAEAAKVARAALREEGEG